MASFDVALNWTLDFEDPRREYAIVPDAPAGAHAIAGVNSVKQATAYALIAEAEQDERAPLVAHFYENTFWNGWLDRLTSDELAKRVFDCAVNMGAGTAVGLLQLSLGINADKCWGPLTVSEANAEPNAVEGFKQARAAHYRAIVDAQPQDAKYLAGWLARAMK